MERSLEAMPAFHGEGGLGINDYLEWEEADLRAYEVLMSGAEHSAAHWSSACGAEHWAAHAARMEPLSGVGHPLVEAAYLKMREQGASLC